MRGRRFLLTGLPNREYDFCTGRLGTVNKKCSLFGDISEILCTKFLQILNNKFFLNNKASGGYNGDFEA